MREGQEGDVDIQDVRKPVFQALLYFTYTDQLPEVQSIPCIEARLHLYVTNVTCCQVARMCMLWL